MAKYAGIIMKTSPPKPKPNEYFTVIITGTVPVVIEYRVFTDNEESAYKLAEQALNGGSSNAIMTRPPKLNIPRLKKIRAVVKKSMSVIESWSKVFG